MYLSLWNDAGERVACNGTIATAVSIELFHQWTAEYIELPGDFVILSKDDPGHDGYPCDSAVIVRDSREG